MRVLIVEDDADVADLLLRAVREVSWAADRAATGAGALSALCRNDYDLAVLDIGLPDFDGLEVCRRWRARGGKTPILMLTARTALADRVRGLDAGADDYLGKPIAIEELLARLRALVRRSSGFPAVTLRVADLELEPATYTVRRAGRPLRLTAREYALLEYLLHNRDRVVSRAQILAHVWDDNFDPISNAVDVLLGRVRRKVDPHGARPLIHTVVGIGYVLAERWPR